MNAKQIAANARKKQSIPACNIPYLPMVRYVVQAIRGVERARERAQDKTRRVIREFPRIWCNRALGAGEHA